MNNKSVNFTAWALTLLGIEAKDSFENLINVANFLHNCTKTGIVIEFIIRMAKTMDKMADKVRNRMVMMFADRVASRGNVPNSERLKVLAALRKLSVSELVLSRLEADEKFAKQSPAERETATKKLLEAHMDWILAPKTTWTAISRGWVVHAEKGNLVHLKFQMPDGSFRYKSLYRHDNAELEKITRRARKNILRERKMTYA